MNYEDVDDIINYYSIAKNMSKHNLDKYSFLWSELRLVVAALALFLGGIPPALKVFGYSSAVLSLLKFSWIISGVASAYLIYRWKQNNKNLFGVKVQKDFNIFLVSIISGLNLGVAGLLGTNIGMNISSAYLIYVIVGLIYLYSAFYLWSRFKTHGARLF